MSDPSLNYSILDWIELSNGEVVWGIIDYANERFVHFYDFSKKDDPDMVIVAILWRMKYSDTRFSVFCAMNFPQIELPTVSLINQIGIETCSEPDLTDKEVSVNKNWYSIKK